MNEALSEFSPYQKKTNIKLCLEIEKHPCLYDSNDNSCRQDVERTWHDIGRKIGISGIACKKRWMNLRTSFVRQRYKRTKKNYYLNKYMQFLIPHIKLSKKGNSRNTNVIAPFEYKYMAQEPDPLPINEQHSVESNNIVESDHTEEIFSVDIKEEIESDTVQADEETANQNLNPHVEDIENSESNAPLFDYLETAKPKLNVYQEDPRRCFLLSLLPELHELREDQFRVFKRRVLALIDDISTPSSII